MVMTTRKIVEFVWETKPRLKCLRCGNFFFVHRNLCTFGCRIHTQICEHGTRFHACCGKPAGSPGCEFHDHIDLWYYKENEDGTTTFNDPLCVEFLEKEKKLPPNCVVCLSDSRLVVRRHPKSDDG